MLLARAWQSGADNKARERDRQRENKIVHTDWTNNVTHAAPPPPHPPKPSLPSQPLADCTDHGSSTEAWHHSLLAHRSLPTHTLLWYCSLPFFLFFFGRPPGCENAFLHASWSRLIKRTHKKTSLLGIFFWTKNWNATTFLEKCCPLIIQRH